jgi:hypothetical protein
MTAASPAPRVTFTELLDEARGEAERHAIWRDDFLQRAARETSAEAAAEMRTAACERDRLARVYGAFFDLVMRIRDDEPILARLKELAEASRVAEAEGSSDGEGDDD